MNEREVVANWALRNMGLRLEITDPAIDDILSDAAIGLRNLLDREHRKPMRESKLGDKLRILRQALLGVLTSQTTPSVALRAAMASSLQLTGTEARVDTLIERVESGFDAFEQKILSKSASVGWPSDQWTRDHFFAPFEVMRINSQNPHKNFPRRNAAGITNIGDNHNFAFNLLPGQTGMVAAFVPLTRSLQVSESIDTSNDLDMLFLQHELKHAALDGNKRNNINSKEQWAGYQAFYVGFANQRPRIDLTEELYAYGLEIEALNLLLDDAVRTGNVPDVQTIRRKLNARPEQERTIDMLLGFASHFYPQRIQPNQPFPQSYVNTIGRTLVQNGYDTYLMHPHTLAVEPYKVAGI